MDDGTTAQKRHPVAFDMTKTSVLSDAPTREHFRWKCPTCGEKNLVNQFQFGAAIVCEHCRAETTFEEDLLMPPTHAGDGSSDDAAPVVSDISAIGKYPVDRFIARGGMGEIWLGRHPNLDIPVAIKLLSSEMIVRNPKYVQRFIKEARTAAQMNHPNVVRIYDSDHADGIYFIVLEYMDGGDVLQLARHCGGRLAPEQALKIVSSVGEALVEASKYNIIHRDIKPENIMLTKSGQVKLADLGIAKRGVSDAAQEATFTNMVLGTPAYIAPEQALNANNVDSRADIYSLGATFYHLVTGAVPFPAKSPFHMMYKHVKEPLRPPQEINPDLPENICSIITKMMEKDPADRYQDLTALMLDLYRVRDHNSPTEELSAASITFRPKTDAATDGSWLRRHRHSLLAVAAIVAMGTLALWGIRTSVEGTTTRLNDQLRTSMLRLSKRRATRGPRPPTSEPAVTPQAKSTGGKQTPPPEQTPPKHASGPTAPEGAPNPPSAPPTTMPEPPPDQTPARPPEVAPERPPRNHTTRTAARFVVTPNKPDTTPATLSAAAAKRAESDRLTKEVSAAVQAILRKKPNPGQGIGLQVEALRRRLDDARAHGARNDFTASIAAMQQVRRESDRLRGIIRDRDQAAQALATSEKARREAVVVGAAETPALANLWQRAEVSYKHAKGAFRDTDFPAAAAAATRAADAYGELQEVVPLLAARDRARKSFHALYDTADKAALRQYTPKLFDQVETSRRVADAAGTDYAVATNGYQAALTALRTALPDAMARRQEAREATRAAAAREEERRKWQAAFDRNRKISEDAGTLVNDPSLGGKAVLLFQDALAGLRELRKETREKQQLADIEKLETHIATLLKDVSAQPQPQHAWLVPELNIELVPINAGLYMQGSATLGPDEGPVHSVVITRAFWIGKYEITQGQYTQLMGNNPSSRKGSARLPVETVTWNNAVAFCQKLTQRELTAGRIPDGFQYRLPTEAEWEYACRSGATTSFSFGDDDGKLHKYANYCDASYKGKASWRDTGHNDGYARTAPVGSYRPNSWNIHDMHGNVAEWCLDAFAQYPAKRVFDPVAESTRMERISRGGSWLAAPLLCRSAKRTASAPTYARNDLGFRLVLAPIPTPVKRKGWGAIFQKD